MKWLDRLVEGLEWVAVLLLVLLAIVGLVAFAIALVAGIVRQPITTEFVLAILDDLLVIFLLFELIRMAFAYVRGMDVVPVALEAVIVGLARKAVALDFSDPSALKKSAALAALFLAVGTTWLMIGRAHSRQ